MPLDFSSLQIHNLNVRQIERIGPRHSRFLLEGEVGTEARVVLPGYFDYAGNRGGWKFPHICLN